ncbi:MAG: PrsW family intramembrane metalloprotease [Anaerolineales bacterium]|nr:PrsW family intramembrane metalloprotease [Anaerolineales bacterium]MCW5855610.1 PrsW family intramembrane metalloprotease [Anaerolineales bacterium]
MSQVPAPTVDKHPFDWLTLLQFGSSGFALASGLTTALGLAVAAAFVPRASSLDGLVQLSSLLGILAAALLLLPSTYYALRRILGKPGAVFRPYGRAFAFSILALPLCIGASYLALEARLDWLVALLYLGPAILVVAWLAWLALRKLGPLSAQRIWGGLAAGLIGVTSFSLALEAVAGVVVLAGLAVYVQVTPELTRAIEALLQASENLDDVSLLAPFMNDPVILLTGLFSLSAVAPLVEEFFKPLAVVLLLRRPLTPAQGFALGALSGAGFALAENLFLSAPAETLAVAVAGRAGASAMHVLTGALAGLALVQARQQRRYVRLLGIYLLNVVIHAVWNGLVLLSAAGAVTLAAAEGLVPAAFAMIGPVLLVGLGSTCILAIWRINQRLQPN